jgi:hypothetical protein
VTFGAMTAWQAWLLAAAAAGAAVGLFLLKVRPPRVRVASVMLWARVLGEAREQTLWERIRRAVSLAITALIAIALAMAFARPSPGVRSAAAATPAAPGAGTARLLVVIDSSWSMLARTRGGGTRWDRAIAEARRVAAAAGGDVAVATTADGIVEGPTPDLTLIETALDRLSASGGGAATLPQLSGAEVHLITDGAVARALDAAVVVHSVHEAAANAGIIAFEVRPPLDGGTAHEAYLEVANFGPPQQVRVTVTRGDSAIFERKIDMAAGEALQQVLRVARDGAPELRARISADNDALGADNEAFGWLQDAKPLTVAVVGSQTTWLARSVGPASGVTAKFVTPGAYAPGAEDLVIFDRWVPAEPPGRPALYIAPPSSAWLGSTSDQLEQQPKWIAAGSSPVLDGVDPLTFSIDRARIYSSALGQPVARSARGNALVSVSAEPGRPRAVVLAFGPLDSNLASAPGFPVLMGNAIDWLGHPLVIPARRTGRAALDETVTRVAGPRGAVPLMKLPGETSAALAAPGIYTAEAGGARATFAVNIADPAVSNLERTTATPSATVLAVSSVLPGRPWWVYLVILGFAGVLIEWWTWLRRITV